MCMYIYIRMYVHHHKYQPSPPSPPQKKGINLCLHATPHRCGVWMAPVDTHVCLCIISICNMINRLPHNRSGNKSNCHPNENVWETSNNGKQRYATQYYSIDLLFVGIFRTLTMIVLAVLIALYILETCAQYTCVYTCIRYDVYNIYNKDDIMNWWHLQTYTHISFVCCNVFTSLKSIISFHHVNTQRLLKTSAATPVVASPALVVQDPNERWSMLEVDLQMLRIWSRNCWV